MAINAEKALNVLQVDLVTAMPNVAWGSQNWVERLGEIARYSWMNGEIFCAYIVAKLRTYLQQEKVNIEIFHLKLLTRIRSAEM